MTLVPCDVEPVWHFPDACDTPFLCEPRDGALEAITTDARAVLDRSKRHGDPAVVSAAVAYARMTVRAVRS